MKGIGKLFSLGKLFLLLSFSLVAQAYNIPSSYNYPIADSFQSTLTSGYITTLESGTKATQYKPYSACIEIYPDQEVCSEAYIQKDWLFRVKKAPVVFILAGLGGSEYATIVSFLAKQFYHNKGVHVITIASPFNPIFQKGAMASSIPGAVYYDSLEVYAFMKKMFNHVKQEHNLKSTDVYLTGYSLGGLEALFIAKEDSQNPFFNFKKVLVINPPVDLVSSAQLLDSYFTKKLSYDEYKNITIETYLRLTDRYWASVSQEKQSQKLLQIPKWHHKNLAKILIGATMQEVCAKSVLTIEDLHDIKSIPNNYADNFQAVNNFNDWGFVKYMNEIVLPFYQNRQDYKGHKNFIYKNSMKSLESFLKKASYINIHHNRDDVIMSQKEIAYIKKVFRNRARIFPTGGHLGNVWWPQNIELILQDLLPEDKK